MLLQELRRGLFGYKKDSVYQYVLYLNEKFNQKLSEKDFDTGRQIKELKDMIADLKFQLSIVKKENEEYTKMQVAVSNSIIDAKSYASQMKKETEDIEEDLRQKLKERYKEENKKLEEYSELVNKVRESIKSVLKEIDLKLEENLKSIEAQKEEEPNKDKHITLFKRNNDASVSI